MINSNSKGTIIITYWLVYCVTAHNGGGYWTTRGYANSRIANSRTELLADYINDIDDCVAGRILKFADDTKIYHTVYSEEDVRACLLYTSPSPRDRQKSRMPSSA